MDLTPIWLLEVLAGIVLFALFVFIPRAMHREAEQRRAEK